MGFPSLRMEKANKLGRRDSYYTLRHTHDKIHFLFKWYKSFTWFDQLKKLYWVETIQVDPSARHKYSSIFNNCNLDWDNNLII